MATMPVPFITPEKYVEMDERSARPLEYVDGEVFEIESSTTNHAAIIVNLTAAVWIRLRGKGCRPYGNAARIKVPSGRYLHPDLSVICGKLDTLPDHTVVNPEVTFEVLSESTSGYDMGHKSIMYRTIPGLKEYLVIDQSRPWVQQWTRHGSRWLVDETAGLESVLRIEALGCEVPFSELYADVEFEVKEL